MKKYDTVLDMSETVPSSFASSPEVAAYHADMFAMLHAEYATRYYEASDTLADRSISPVTAVHHALERLIVLRTAKPEEKAFADPSTNTVAERPFQELPLRDILALPEDPLPLLRKPAELSRFDKKQFDTITSQLPGYDILSRYQAIAKLTIMALRNIPDNDMAPEVTVRTGASILQFLDRETFSQIPDEETRAYARFALRMFDLISETNVTQQEVIDSLALASGTLIVPRHIERKPLPPIEPAVEESSIEELILRDAEQLGWKILSPDVREALQDIETQTAVQETGTRGNGSVYDKERLKFLYYLKENWPQDGATILALDLVTTGKGMYLALVLPEYLPNGLLVRHCVADNPVTNNSLLVWRAEHGLTLDGNGIMFDWTDVFEDKKGRNHAVALGAKKMNHTPTLHKRVEDYLLADADSL